MLNKQAYLQGFVETCQRYGINNPEQINYLIKNAQEAATKETPDTWLRPDWFSKNFPTLFNTNIPGGYQFKPLEGFNPMEYASLQNLAALGGAGIGAPLGYYFGQTPGAILGAGLGGLGGYYLPSLLQGAPTGRGVKENIIEDNLKK